MYMLDLSLLETYMYMYSVTQWLSKSTTFSSQLEAETERACKMQLTDILPQKLNE